MVDHIKLLSLSQRCRSRNPRTKMLAKAFEFWIRMTRDMISMDDCSKKVWFSQSPIRSTDKILNKESMIFLVAAILQLCCRESVVAYRPPGKAADIEMVMGTFKDEEKA